MLVRHAMASSTRAAVDHMDPYKTMFAADTTARTLADAMEGADVFLGVSVGGPGLQGDGQVDGRPSDRVRAGQSRPRDQLSTMLARHGPT